MPISPKPPRAAKTNSLLSVIQAGPSRTSEPGGAAEGPPSGAGDIQRSAASIASTPPAPRNSNRPSRVKPFEGAFPPARGRSSIRTIVPIPAARVSQAARIAANPSPSRPEVERLVEPRRQPLEQVGGADRSAVVALEHGGRITDAFGRMGADRPRSRPRRRLVRSGSAAAFDQKAGAFRARR